MKNYEITISPNYVNNWGIKEAIREILQNAIDGENEGYEKTIEYRGGVLYIKNEGISLSAKDLILGCSSKGDFEGMIGKYGEGFKLALVVLLRKGLMVEIQNGNKIWRPSFKVSSVFNTQVLNIEEEESEDEGCLCFSISPIDETLYKNLENYFPCINDDFGEVVECDNGQILLDAKFKGKMFVEGLYIQTDENFKYGYNFNSDVVELDRDRKAINYYELRALTAESIVTAEECHPKLFKAISDSCVDTKDIIDVLDKASDTFLQEYKDMFYEEKNLEEDTLVATGSVMKQLEQMEIDVPVVEGTEIESYLIAIANDKLGLIEKAESRLDERSAVEKAIDGLYASNYAKLMAWYKKYGHNLDEEAKESFITMANGFKTYSFSLLKDYIDEDFDYSDEAILGLKDKV